MAKILCFAKHVMNLQSRGFFIFQVERMWDLVRDSGQRKLTSSFQNHCTLHSVPVGAKPLSPRQCAPSRSIYLSRRLNSHWEILVTTHHLQKWESQLRLRWKIAETVWFNPSKVSSREDCSSVFCCNSSFSQTSSVRKSPSSRLSSGQHCRTFLIFHFLSVC